jgi:hypothetical protein
MVNHQIRIGIIPIVVLLCMVGGCDLLRRSKPQSEVQKESTSEGSSYIPIPMGISDELRDSEMPILRVALIKNKKNQLVPVPYFYGYPFYASVEAKAGIYRFREDIWTGYLREENIDDDGVTYLTELFPDVDCAFYGILETKEKYIPMYLECLLPPPNNMGGRKRPVVGDVMVGANPQEILSEPSIKKAFLGDWHAVTPGFEDGNGTGYFNTEHGQLGFGFKGGKLNKIVYMFDPPVKLWRSPEIWLTH